MLRLQMPRSLKARSNNKNISSCRQPLEATCIPWQGRAGPRRAVSPEQTSQCCSTLSWEAFGFQSGDEASQHCLNKHTYSAPGVLPHKHFRWMHPAAPAGSTALPQPRRGLMELIRISRRSTKVSGESPSESAERYDSTQGLWTRFVGLSPTERVGVFSYCF